MPNEAAQAAMPARSRLYSLPLAGDSGETQEALLDYAQRLSVAHHVRPREMFSQVILPEAGLSGAFFIPGHFSVHAVRGCNGWSSYACAFLGAMQRLTGRMDMSKGTLACWAPLLDDRGYVARTRQWCPECLQTQKVHGLPAFSLLWAFEVVRVCTRHQLQLCNLCGRCGRHQPFIGDAVAHGLCEHCHAPLSESLSQVARPSSASADFFRARAMAGMIALHDHGLKLAAPDVFRQQLQGAADQVTNGSLFRLEKQLNLSYMSLAARRRTTLRFFLEVMYRLGVEPVPFLQGAAAVEPKARLSEVPFRVQRRFTPAEIAETRVRVDVRLDLAKREKCRLTTRIEFVRDVGITNSMLESRFPEAASALRDHNEGIRPAVHRALWTRRAELIGKAMHDLVATHGPFSAHAIGSALRQAGLHRRNPRVRKLAAEALERELKAAQP